jgi:hypothetical protein
MFKIVKGSVDELEAKLNEAAASGFTEIIREFFEAPSMADVMMNVEGINVEEASRGLVPPPIDVPKVQRYAFLLRKPRQPIDDVEPIIGAMRSMAMQMGFQLPSLGKLIKLDGGKETPPPDPPG